MRAYIARCGRAQNHTNGRGPNLNEEGRFAACVLLFKTRRRQHHPPATKHWLNSAAAACRPKVACRDSNAPSQQTQLKRNGISRGELGDARPYRSTWGGEWARALTRSRRQQWVR